MTELICSIYVLIVIHEIFVSRVIRRINIDYIDFPGVSV